jgi:hypothetical protein
LAIGYWLLAIGYWLLAIGYWLLAIADCAGYGTRPCLRSQHVLSALSVAILQIGVLA